MEILQAILLGIVEGLTEFLPISSTGHLIVAEDMLGYHDTSKLFTVFIQIGAIAAVIWFYRRQLAELLFGAFRGDTQARRFLLVWIIATVPAGLTGFLFESKIERYGVPLTVAIALILGGIAIWIIETYHRSPAAKGSEKMHKISFRQAVLIGFYQVLALIPGVSRSGATILGGVLTGLDRVTATAFSFYLGIPILVLAGAYKLATGDISLVPGGSSALLAGTAASFVTAFFVVGWLLRYVSRHDLKAFAYYRVGFGLFLLLLIGIGTIG